MDTRDRNRTTARRYAGGNERLDNLLSNFSDTVWVVEGVNGRKILIADTEALAIEQYNAVPNRWKKSEKDS